jgi:hypothetical protein
MNKFKKTFGCLPGSMFGFESRLLNRGIIVNYMLIAILLLCLAVIFFFKSYYRESVSDDLIYKYMVDALPLGPASATYQMVHNFSDVLVSQSHQYCYLNGRTIVHIFVQMFAGVWGLRAFSIFNAILAIIAMVALVTLTQTYDNKKNILLWAFMAIAIFYLFPSPSGLFYSIAGSFNYLFPITTSAIFFIFLGKVVMCKLSKVGIVIFSIFSFIAGWTMEAFTLPISGGLFFWLIINRRKVKFTIAPIITFWIGAAVLVLAPGNFVRLDAGGSRAAMLMQAVKYFGEMKIFWLFLIACIMYCIKDRNGFKSYCKRNQLYFLTLAVSILFFCYVNTLIQSCSCIEFISLILLFKILDKYFSGMNHRLLKYICSVICIMLMCVHQYYIIQDCRTIQLQTKKLVSDIQRMDAEIMPKPEFHTSSLIAPFVPIWYNSPALGWNEEVISIVYRHRKPFHLLSQKDYNAVNNQEKFFVASNIVAGNAHAYEGEDYYWFKKSVLEDAREVELVYYPISWTEVNSLRRALKYIFARNSYVVSQRFEVQEKVSLGSSSEILMLPKVDRRVKSISIVR